MPTGMLHSRAYPGTTPVVVSVCVCVDIFIKLHITAQSDLVTLVIICHSQWSSQGGMNDTCYENL